MFYEDPSHRLLYVKPEFALAAVGVTHKSRAGKVPPCLDIHSSIVVNMYNLVTILSFLLLSGDAASAQPYYGHMMHHSLAGRIIAGIIVAVVCGLLLFCLFWLLIVMYYRRRGRRAGVPSNLSIPWLSRFRPEGTGYAANNFQYQPQTQTWNTPAVYSPPVEPPPPAYQRKESSYPVYSGIPPAGDLPASPGYPTTQ
ncbi:hypothetical protein NM688_g2792 [Phlebia brevispora]|uniref:Uncharacterized protein n=1 Tax=Phlebia brevispora TaxID=194682 RepID=A0ACC1T7L9_9APHY|nr:hypothetical protein NM688_g2792 [Phlebia brevispora]